MSADIEIHGRRYRLKGDSVQKVKQCADYLNLLIDQIESKFDIFDRDKLFVLSAMTIAEELLDTKQELEELKKTLLRGTNLIDEYIKNN